jgi:hypothetical protein
VGKQIYIYVDGEQEFSSNISHINGDISIRLPGLYSDGGSGDGTESCIDYLTVTSKEFASPEAEFS